MGTKREPYLGYLFAALIAAVVLLTLVAFLVFRGADAQPPGPTGLTGTSVGLPSGRVVECVLGRDASRSGSVAIAVDCDW